MTVAGVFCITSGITVTSDLSVLMAVSQLVAATSSSNSLAVTWLPLLAAAR